MIYRFIIYNKYNVKIKLRKYRIEKRRNMDLNLLIATVVTATAALVAITGGFLISRVIALSSEQNSIRRRLKEIDIEIATKTQFYKRVEKNLLEEDQEDFIYDYCKELIIDKTSLKVILERQDGMFRGRIANELEPAVDELTRINIDLNRMFEAAGVEYSDDLPNEFDDFINLRPQNLNGRKNWYEILYVEYMNELPKRPKSSSLRFPHFSDIHLSTIQSLPNNSPQSVQLYQQKQRDRDTYKNEISYLKRQRLELKDILINFGKPSGMWGGLVVLVYASIVGIGYPVTLLPYQTETYNDEATRILILLLFFSHLLVLFVYLGVNMFILTKNEKFK